MPLVLTADATRVNLLVGTFPPVGPVPVLMTCPFCQSSIETKIELISTCKTYFCAANFFLCFICARFCIDLNDFKVKEHYCPNCDAFLGAYKL